MLVAVVESGCSGKKKMLTGDAALLGSFRGYRSEGGLVGKGTTAVVLRFFIAVSSFTGLAAFTYVKQVRATSSFQEIFEQDKTVQELLPLFSGVIRVTLNGEPILSEVFEPENRYPYSDSDQLTLDTNAIFPVASITKQFVAAMVLRKVQEGALSLTTPLSEVLPSIPSNWKNIQIVHILTHASGIADHLTDVMIARLQPRNLTPNQIFEELQRIPLRIRPQLVTPKPASRLNSPSYGIYSNGNYLALALVLEELWRKKHGTERTWPELLKAELLIPLGLRETAVVGNPDLDPELVLGFEKNGSGRFVPAPLLSSSMLYGCGDIISTAENLSRWSRILFETDFVLQPEFRRLLTTAVSGEYTYGGRVGVLNKQSFHLRTGTLRGQHHVSAYFPESKLSIVVLGHQDGSPVKALSERIAKIVFDLLN